MTLPRLIPHWFDATLRPFRSWDTVVLALVLTAATRNLVMHTVLTPEFALVVALTLMLERWFPAKPDQPVLSLSFAQDGVWFFYESMLQALIVVTYASNPSFDRAAPS